MRDFPYQNEGFPLFTKEILGIKLKFIITNRLSNYLTSGKEFPNEKISQDGPALPLTGLYIPVGGSQIVRFTLLGDEKHVRYIFSKKKCPMTEKEGHEMKNFLNWSGVRLGFILFGLLCSAFTASSVLAESETPEETLTWCESLALDASEQAFKAQVTCDYPTAHQALSLANEAAYLAAKVSRFAQDTANSRLALSAYNVCNQVKSANADVAKAAQYIATQSPNPDAVHAAKLLLEDCEVVQKTNNVSMEIALMPLSEIPEGAEAYSK